MGYKDILEKQKNQERPKLVFDKFMIVNVSFLKPKSKVVIGDVTSEVKKTKKPKRNSYDIKGYAKKAMEQNGAYKKTDNSGKFYVDMDKVKQNVVTRKHKRR